MLLNVDLFLFGAVRHLAFVIFPCISLFLLRGQSFVFFDQLSHALLFDLRSVPMACLCSQLLRGVFEARPTKSFSSYALGMCRLPPLGLWIRSCLSSLGRILLSCRLQWRLCHFACRVGFFEEPAKLMAAEFLHIAITLSALLLVLYVGSLHRVLDSCNQAQPLLGFCLACILLVTRVLSRCPCNCRISCGCGCSRLLLGSVSDIRVFWTTPSLLRCCNLLRRTWCAPRFGNAAGINHLILRSCSCNGLLLSSTGSLRGLLLGLLACFARLRLRDRFDRSTTVVCLCSLLRRL
mmetsp:Transcript_123373/g.227265  ORF Transcript_123373/g.227265 Transcript_123373/m.227265 type:complete len:293 (-) Transcript_123373:35-913(-)